MNKGKDKEIQTTFLPIIQDGEGCCSVDSRCDNIQNDLIDTSVITKTLQVDLLVIDLETCARCVPTGDQLRTAVQLLSPVAQAMGIELKYRAIVAQTPEEAKKYGLLSSPTIRLNGHDIAQDIRESVCESCGDLTENNTVVDCREWHYRGKIYSAAPLPLLLEAIMVAMLKIDEIPIVNTPPLDDLPENLQRYFDNKKRTGGSSCCS